jgi:hypothetical protein
VRTGARWRNGPYGDVLVLGHVVCIFGGYVRAAAGGGVRACDIDDEWGKEWEWRRTANVRSWWWTGREEGAVRAVCVECAYEERKTDRETDGDDQCTAGCTKAENTWGHNLNSFAVQDLLVLIGCAAGAGAARWRLVAKGEY